MPVVSFIKFPTNIRYIVVTCFSAEHEQAGQKIPQNYKLKLHKSYKFFSIYFSIKFNPVNSSVLVFSLECTPNARKLVEVVIINLKRKVLKLQCWHLSRVTVHNLVLQLCLILPVFDFYRLSKPSLNSFEMRTTWQTKHKINGHNWTTHRSISEDKTSLKPLERQGSIFLSTYSAMALISDRISPA